MRLPFLALGLGFGFALLSACGGGSSNGGSFATGDAAAPPGNDADGGAAPDAVNTAEPCGRYLSCLLATTPEAYGAAIQLYGDDSACWKTPGQERGCNQACTSAFEKIADGCSCEGATCTKCDDLPSYRHTSSVPGRRMSCTDGAMYPADDVVLDFSSQPGRAISGAFTVSQSETMTLTGTADCTGAFTLTGERNFGDSVNRWTVLVKPTNDPDAFDIAATNKRTNPFDPERTCTFSARLTR